MNEETLAHWGGGAVAPKTKKEERVPYDVKIILNVCTLICLFSAQFHSMLLNRRSHIPLLLIIKILKMVAIFTTKLKGRKHCIFATSYIRKVRAMFKNHLWFHRKS